MFDTQEVRAQAPVEVSPPGALPLPSSTPQSTHVLDRLNAVFKHRRLAATAFLLVVTAMMVQTYSTIPVYEAWSRVQIQDERTTQVGTLNANDPAFWQESGPYYQTQYSILQSRGLARRVVRTLDLQKSPLFNGSAPPPHDPLSLARQARAAASAWLRRLITRSANTPAAPPAPDESAQEAGLITAFLGGLSIRPEPNSRLVKIVYSHSDPKFAALAANTVADEYTQQNIDLRLQNTEKTLKWLGEELKRQEQQLAASEGALTEYRERNNALSLEDRQNIVVSRLNQLNEKVTTSRNDRLSKEAIFNQLRIADPASDTVDNFPVVGTNSGVVEAKNALSTLIAQKASYAGRYGPEHPRMVEVTGQIENAKRRLVAERTKVLESIKNDYSAALAQERSFSAQLEEQKGGVDGPRSQERRLQAPAAQGGQRSAGLPVAAHAAEGARRRRQQPREQRAGDGSRRGARRSRSSPNPRRDWITAILAGLTIALGLAFGIEYLDDTVKTPEDITRAAEAAAARPGAGGARRPRAGADRDRAARFRRSVPLAAHVAGLHQRRASTTRIIAVTSSQPLEGKTTTACNLAMALALGGSRVLLIDADMRRPGLHKTLGPAERDRPVAPAGRPGARARGGSAHERAEPAGDHRRPDAAQPVRAARRPSG